MRLYITIILSAVAIIISANGIYVGVTDIMPVWHVIVLTVAVVAALFMLDLIFATVIHMLLPKKWFNPLLKGYRVGKGERRFYDALKIIKWKDKIPETGKVIGQFDKTKVGPLEAENLFLFLRETCYAEIIHYAMILTSFIIPIFFSPLFFSQSFFLEFFFWTITLTCSLVNFILQIPPIFIQRYNRPRLLRLYELKMNKKTKK